MIEDGTSRFSQEIDALKTDLIDCRTANGWKLIVALGLWKSLNSAVSAINFDDKAQSPVYIQNGSLSMNCPF
jgi:hypothetical protein